MKGPKGESIIGGKVRIYCALPTKGVSANFSLIKQRTIDYFSKLETTTPCKGNTKYPNKAIECQDQQVICKTGNDSKFRVRFDGGTYKIGNKTYKLPIAGTGPWVSKPCGT